MSQSSVQQLAIRYGDQRLEFEWIADAKRTDKIRITVDPLTGVQVFTPAHAGSAEVRAAVRRRARWISRRLYYSTDKQRHSRFVSGEQLLYLGKRYVLNLATAKDTSVKMKAGTIRVEVPGCSTAHVEKALNHWYRETARRYFGRRLLALYSCELGGKAEPPPFRLQAMTRKWGSCSPAGKLLLNPALIRAPRECVDYVLMHELCHLRHHDHSPAFKKLLCQKMPDWETRKALLEFVADDVLRAD